MILKDSQRVAFDSSRKTQRSGDWNVAGFVPGVAAPHRRNQYGRPQALVAVPCATDLDVSRIR